MSFLRVFPWSVYSYSFWMSISAQHSFGPVPLAAAATEYVVASGVGHTAAVEAFKDDILHWDESGP